MKVARVVVVQHLLHLHIAKASDYVIVQHLSCRKPTSSPAEGRFSWCKERVTLRKQTFFFFNVGVETGLQER